MHFCIQQTESGDTSQLRKVILDVATVDEGLSIYDFNCPEYLRL